MRTWKIFAAGMALTFAVGLFLGTPGLADETQKDVEVTKAVRSAKAWLGQVDRGQYNGSWDEAATMFQRVMPKNQWQRTLDGVRTPLGRVKSRTLIGAKRTSSLPGAPDGDYVVIQFKTSFDGKKSAVETVTPMKDRDGKWRVSGYYIK